MFYSGSTLNCIMEPAVPAASMSPRVRILEYSAADISLKKVKMHLTRLRLRRGAERDLGFFQCG